MRIKSLILCVVFIVVTLFCFSCNNSNDDSKMGNVEEYVHPNFVTNYTKEEHIERITKRTEEIFKEEIENNNVVNIFVDIVYAFYDNDPEYFLVELEYSKQVAYEKVTVYSPYYNEITITSKYKHLIGYIQDDEYYTGLYYYTDRGSDGIGAIKNSFMGGESVYNLYGCITSEKYFGDRVYAIKKDDKFICLHKNHAGCYIPKIHVLQPTYEKNYCSVGEIIIKEEYEDLMLNNRKYRAQQYKAS